MPNEYKSIFVVFYLLVIMIFLIVTTAFFSNFISFLQYRIVVFYVYVIKPKKQK